MSIWIYTDADNTLWDTNAVYALAQLTLLRSVEEEAGSEADTRERLEFVRSFDQEIAKSHHSGLRYPPALLLRALSDGIRGVPPGLAAQHALAEGSIPTALETEALRLYTETLSSLPPVLDGVNEGLRLAQNADVPVYVVSEGKLEALREKLAALGLEKFVSGVLAATKSPDLFARLKQRALPRHAVMIGDQPDKDIRFAHEGGVRTVLVEGRFRPHWINPADRQLADAVVESFLDAVQWAISSENKYKSLA